MTYISKFRTVIVLQWVCLCIPICVNEHLSHRCWLVLTCIRICMCSAYSYIAEIITKFLRTLSVLCLARSLPVQSILLAMYSPST